MFEPNNFYFDRWSLLDNVIQLLFSFFLMLDTPNSCIFSNKNSFPATLLSFCFEEEKEWWIQHIYRRLVDKNSRCTQLIRISNIIQKRNWIERIFKRKIHRDNFSIVSYEIWIVFYICWLLAESEWSIDPCSSTILTVCCDRCFIIACDMNFIHCEGKILLLGNELNIILPLCIKGTKSR